MKKNKIIGLILAATLVISSTALFTGCDEEDESNDRKQANQTEQLQQQSSAKLGMPNIKNFYEKQTLKNIMEQCDDSNLVTYTYTKNCMTGKYVFIGQSIGYGIPYGTEYTNPKYDPYPNSDSGVVLPQADPNGLYKAENVNATWVMIIDPQTKQAKPQYIEDNILVSQTKLPKRLCDVSSLPSDY